MSDISIEIIQNSLLHLLGTSLIPAIVPFVAAWLAAIFTLKSFYSQQRTNRIQKVYFEEALNKQLNGLEKAMVTLDENMARIQWGINRAIHWVKQRKSSWNILIDNFNEIACVNKAAILGSYTPKETILDMFDDKHEAYQLVTWISSVESDIAMTIEKINGQLSVIADKLSSKPPTTDTEHKGAAKFLSEMSKLILNDYQLAKRHTTLLRLFTRFVNSYAETDFKNKKELMSYKNNPKIKNLLKEIDECRRRLFMFYKSGNIYYSYTARKGNERIKLNFNGPKPIAHFEIYYPSENDELVLPINQSELAELKIEGTQEFIVKILKTTTSEYLFRDKKNYKDNFITIEKF